MDPPLAHPSFPFPFLFSWVSCVVSPSDEVWENAKRHGHAHVRHHPGAPFPFPSVRRDGRSRVGGNANARGASEAGGEEREGEKADRGRETRMRACAGHLRPGRGGEPGRVRHGRGRGRAIGRGGVPGAARGPHRRPARRAVPQEPKGDLVDLDRTGTRPPGRIGSERESGQDARAPPRDPIFHVQRRGRPAIDPGRRRAEAPRVLEGVPRPRRRVGPSSPGAVLRPARPRHQQGDVLQDGRTRDDVAVPATGVRRCGRLGPRHARGRHGVPPPREEQSRVHGRRDRGRDRRSVAAEAVRGRRDPASHLRRLESHHLGGRRERRDQRILQVREGTGPSRRPRPPPSMHGFGTRGGRRIQEDGAPVRFPASRVRQRRDMQGHRGGTGRPGHRPADAAEERGRGRTRRRLLEAPAPAGGIRFGQGPSGPKPRPGAAPSAVGRARRPRQPDGMRRGTAGGAVPPQPRDRVHGREGRHGRDRRRDHGAAREERQGAEKLLHGRA
eukprot:scaffold770_cov362-Pavlova_lutheri.AAC.5